MKRRIAPGPPAVTDCVACHQPTLFPSLDGLCPRCAGDRARAEIAVRLLGGERRREA